MGTNKRKAPKLTVMTAKDLVGGMELSVLIKNIKFTPGAPKHDRPHCFVGVHIREPKHEQVCRTDEMFVPEDKHLIVAEKLHFKLRSLDSTVMVLLLSRNEENPAVPILIDKIKLSLRKLQERRNGRQPIFYLENGTFANVVLTLHQGVAGEG